MVRSLSGCLEDPPFSGLLDLREEESALGFSHLPGGHLAAETGPKYIPLGMRYVRNPLVMPGRCLDRVPSDESWPWRDTQGIGAFDEA